MSLSVNSSTKVKTARLVVIFLAVISIIIIAFSFINSRLDNANAAPTPDNYFSFDAATGTITDYDPTGGSADPAAIVTDVVVPDSIGGVAVKSIAKYKAIADADGPATSSFRGKGLTSVVVGDSVETIGIDAFAENPMVSVSLGTSSYSGPARMELDGGNFNPMSGSVRSDLVNVNIGPVVKSIRASFNDSSIVDISLPENLESTYYSFVNSLVNDFTYVGSATFTAYSFSDSEYLESLSVDTTGDIYGMAFSNLRSITKIEVPNVNEIGGGSFADLASSSVESLEIILGKVNLVGGGSFRAISNLTKLHIDEVGSITGGAFHKSTGLDAESGLDVSINKGGVIYNFFQGFNNVKSIKLVDVDELDYAFTEINVATNSLAANVTIENAGKIKGSSFIIVTLESALIQQAGDIEHSFYRPYMQKGNEAYRTEFNIIKAGNIEHSFHDYDRLSNVKLEDVGNLQYSFHTDTRAADEDYINIDIEKSGNLTYVFYGYSTIGSLNIEDSLDISHSFNSEGELGPDSPALNMFIGKSGNILNSFRDNPNLSSIVLNQVGNINISFYNTSSTLTRASTASSLRVEVIKSGDVEHSFNDLPNLSYADMRDIGSIYGSFIGSGSQDLAGSLPLGINIGKTAGDIKYSFIRLVNLKQFTVNYVGGAIEARSLSELNNVENINIGTVNGRISESSFTAWGSDSGAAEQSISIEEVNGSIDDDSLSGLPSLVRFRVGVVDGNISDDSLAGNPKLKYVTLGRTGHGDVPKTAINGTTGAFAGSNAITHLYLYDTVLSIEPSTFAGKNITHIYVSGDVDLTADAFIGNNSNTGQYIRVYTHDLSNPHGYLDKYIEEDGDVRLAYIVNPARLTVKYVDSSNGNSIKPSVSGLGEGVDSYVMSDNPVINNDYASAYAKYYRVGSRVNLVAPAHAGYLRPDDNNFLVSEFDGGYTFSYARSKDNKEPEEPTMSLNDPKTPGVDRPIKDTKNPRDSGGVDDNQTDISEEGVVLEDYETATGRVEASKSNISGAEGSNFNTKDSVVDGSALLWVAACLFGAGGIFFLILFFYKRGKKEEEGQVR